MDSHCQMIMNEFIKNKKFFDEARDFIQQTLCRLMKESGIYVVAVESRVKDPVSLEGKLDRKGHKYHSLSDITDIIGARIITFYSPEVDKVNLESYLPALLKMGIGSLGELNKIVKDFFCQQGQKTDRAEHSAKMIMKYAEKLQLSN